MFVLVRPATYVIRQANIGITRAQADLKDGMGGVRQSSQLQLKETAVPPPMLYRHSRGYMS